MDYGNNDAGRNGRIMNEIARKVDGKGSSKKTGDVVSDNPTIYNTFGKQHIGTYNSSWLEPNEIATIAILKIAENGEALSFEWTVNDISVYKGIGMQVGLTDISVFYWKTNSTPPLP